MNNPVNPHRFFTIFSYVKFNVYCIIAATLFMFHPITRAKATPKATDIQFTSKPKTMIQVELTTHLGNQPSFTEGDTYRLLVNLDQAAYLRVYYQNNAGALLQIYPHSTRESGFHEAGYFFSLSSNNNTMVFKVTQPLGTEHFWLFACDKPWPLFKYRRDKQGFLLMAESFNVLQQHIKQFAQNQCTQWGESHLQIETHP